MASDGDQLIEDITSEDNSLDIEIFANLYSPGNLIYKGKVKIKANNGIFRRWQIRFVALRFPSYICIAKNKSMVNPKRYSLVNYREIKVKSLPRKEHIKKKYLKITLVSVYPDMHIKFQCTSQDQYIKMKYALPAMLDMGTFQRIQNQRALENLTRNNSHNNNREGPIYCSVTSEGSNYEISLSSWGSTFDDHDSDDDAKQAEVVDESATPNLECGDNRDVPAPLSQASLSAAPKVPEKLSMSSHESSCALNTAGQLSTLSQAALSVPMAVEEKSYIPSHVSLSAQQEPQKMEASSQAPLHDQEVAKNVQERSDAHDCILHPDVHATVESYLLYSVVLYTLLYCGRPPSLLIVKQATASGSNLDAGYTRPELAEGKNFASLPELRGHTQDTGIIAKTASEGPVVVAPSDLQRRLSADVVAAGDVAIPPQKITPEEENEQDRLEDNSLVSKDDGEQKAEFEEDKHDNSVGEEYCANRDGAKSKSDEIEFGDVAKRRGDAYRQATFDDVLCDGAGAEVGEAQILCAGDDVEMEFEDVSMESDHQTDFERNVTVDDENSCKVADADSSYGWFDRVLGTVRGLFIR